MKIEGYVLVVDDGVFVDDVINLGRGATKYNVPLCRLFQKLEDAKTEEKAIQENSDGNYDIQTYKVIFEVPNPRPAKILAKATRVKRKR